MARNGKTHSLRRACDLLPEERSASALHSANALHAVIHDTPLEIGFSRKRGSQAKSLRAIRVNEEDRIRNALVTISILLEDNEAFLPIYLRLEADLKNAENHRAALERAKAYARRSR